MQSIDAAVVVCRDPSRDAVRSVNVTKAVFQNSSDSRMLGNKRKILHLRQLEPLLAVK